MRARWRRVARFAIAQGVPADASTPQLAEKGIACAALGRPAGFWLGIGDAHDGRASFTGEPHAWQNLSTLYTMGLVAR